MKLSFERVERSMCLNEGHNFLDRHQSYIISFVTTCTTVYNSTCVQHKPVYNISSLSLSRARARTQTQDTFQLHIYSGECQKEEVTSHLETQSPSPAPRSERRPSHSVAWCSRWQHTRLLGWRWGLVRGPDSNGPFDEVRDTQVTSWPAPSDQDLPPEKFTQVWKCPPSPSNK